MKIYFMLLAIFFVTLSNNSQAKINTFACEPEWKSLADEIGGDKIKSFSATSAKQDPHYIRARPSLIAKIRKADLLICSGADLEVGWLPILLQKGSADIQPGKTGNLMVADFVPTIEKPQVIDRSMGDIHAEGNPHTHLNPYNILLVAKEINKRLQLIDSNNAQFYQKNYDNFAKEWKKSIKVWEFKARNLKGLKVVVHHKSFSYLFDWLGIDQVAVLEAKPGISPNISHLENILISLKKEPAKLILITPFDPKKASNWLAAKTGTKELILPFTVHNDEKTNDLFKLFDQTIQLINNKI